MFWQDEATSQPPNVFLTRLHVRYDGAHFPEDLVFQETPDRSTFQGRFVLRHPWTGAATCDAAGMYRWSVWERREQEAQRLASLTGWPLAAIRAKMNLGDRPPVEPAAWWERIWKN